MMIMFLDWTSFQILTMLSGYLGVTEQACQIILWNIMSLLWQIPFGFQMAICALVGNEIGAQNVDRAKYVAKVVFGISQMFNLLEFVFLVIFREYLVKAFTSSIEI